MYQDLNVNNFMFSNQNTSIGDNLLEPLHKLKEYAELCNIKVSTSSETKIDDADAVVFIDIRKNNKDQFYHEALKKGKKLFLLSFEGPIGNIDSHSYDKHGMFEKVYTWNDQLIDKDPAKYTKINFSHNFNHRINVLLDNKSKFCVLIAGNKKNSIKNELYSERLKAIKWFNKYHSEEFDLYGVGWDRRAFDEIRYIRLMEKALDKVGALGRYQVPKVYKGKVKRKQPVLSQYKFCICFENLINTPGWITEKIFDCFMADTVPVYLGPNNITDYVPQNCFIDKAKFDTYEDLYDYLKSMNKIEYEEYRNNINSFLNSDKLHQFTIEYFAKTVVDSIKLSIKG